MLIYRSLKTMRQCRPRRQRRLLYVSISVPRSNKLISQPVKKVAPPPDADSDSDAAAPTPKSKSTKSAGTAKQPLAESSESNRTSTKTKPTATAKGKEKVEKRKVAEIDEDEDEAPAPVAKRVKDKAKAPPVVAEVPVPVEAEKKKKRKFGLKAAPAFQWDPIEGVSCLYRHATTDVHRYAWALVTRKVGLTNSPARESYRLPYRPCVPVPARSVYPGRASRMRHRAVCCPSFRDP